MTINFHVKDEYFLTKVGLFKNVKKKIFMEKHRLREES